MSDLSKRLQPSFAANLEIHFHDQERVSVILETNGGEYELLGELFLFTAFACRQLVNLGRGKIGDSLAQILIGSSTNLEVLVNYKDSSGAYLVEYVGFPGRRIYEAKIILAGERYSFTMNPKGFGILGRGQEYYAPSSAFLLLQYFAKRRLNDPGFIDALGNAALGCGRCFLSNELTVISQNKMTNLIVAGALERASVRNDLRASSTGPSAEGLTPSKLGQYLADLVSGIQKTFLDLLIRNTPNKTRGDAFLAIAALHLFAWIRASQNTSLKIDRTIHQEIYNNVASFLAARYVIEFAPHDNPDLTVLVITTRAKQLLDVWRESQNKEPSPHHYVAKEVFFFINDDRNRIDLGIYLALSKVLEDQTLALWELAKQLQHKLQA